MKSRIYKSVFILGVILLNAFFFPLSVHGVTLPEENETGFTPITQISTLLENAQVRLTFNTNPNGLIGLASVYDKTTPYLHPVESNPAWRVIFMKNAPPYTEVPVESNVSGTTKSASATTQTDGTKILALKWENVPVAEGETANVTQTYTLSPGEPFAHMGIAVAGANLTNHSIKFLEPRFRYKGLPTNSLASIPIRKTWMVKNPQSFSGFQGAGYTMNQIAFGIYDIYPAGTESLLHLAVHDPSGYAKISKFKGNGADYELGLGVHGDKQKLPNQDFIQPYDVVIGAVRGLVVQDWYASAELYAAWQKNQPFFPGLLYDDTTRLPAYAKKQLNFISIFSGEPPATAAEITGSLNAPYSTYGLAANNHSAAPVFGATPQSNWYTPYPNVSAALPLANPNIHPIAFSSMAYLANTDPAYLGNASLAGARILDINSEPLVGQLPPANLPTHTFDASSPVWQAHELEHIQNFIPEGFDGAYYDSPGQELDYRASAGHHGGGSFAQSGINAILSTARQANRGLDPDWTQYTEANFEHNAKNTDFILTEGFTGRVEQQAIGLWNGADRKNMIYVPLDHAIQSGRVIRNGNDRSWAWGAVNFTTQKVDTEAYLAQIAANLSLGFIPTENQNKDIIVVTVPGGNILTPGNVTVPGGYSYDPGTWTVYTSEFFPAQNEFWQNIITAIPASDKYARFGRLLRTPITNSPTIERTYYDLNPPTKVDVPLVPVGAFRALDNTVGFYAVNPTASNQTVSITANFTLLGLTPGTTYKLYEKGVNSVTLLGQFTNTFTHALAIPARSAKTLILVSAVPGVDPDGDGEAATRYDTGATWDNCPTISNPNQLDSDNDGIGDACELAIAPPPPPPPGPTGSGNTGGSSSGGGGNSPSSPTLVTPATPDNFAVITLSPTRVRYTWTDNATNELGFKLEHSTNETAWIQVNTFPANATSFEYEGLVPGSTHYYRLRAYNAAGNSAYTPVISVTLPQAALQTFTVTLAKGITHPQVTLLQQFLAKDPALYPEGLVTGYFGGLTEAAVKRFQKRHALVQSGVLDAPTRAKLNTLYSATPPPPPPAGQAVFTVNLSRGMAHTQIRLLQEYLKKNSALYPEGIVSGYFGGLTEAAVKRFQTKYGIVSSGSAATTGYGRVGPATRAKLNTLYPNVP